MTSTIIDAPERTAPAALDCIDLDRYPLHRPHAPLYRQRVAEARASLEEDGCCVIPGLIREGALPDIAAETQALAPDAYRTAATLTVYGAPPCEDAPEGDPLGIGVRRSNAFVAADRIGPERRIRQLYESPDFRAFVGRCMGMGDIYAFADPLGQLVVNVLEPGASHGWHFDTNEFAVSLVTQPPESGGSFQYAPQIRTPEDGNPRGIANVLDGERGRVRSLDLKAGDLQLFFGRYSLHRVAPVGGSRSRHTVIFAYARQPDLMSKAEKSRQLFGRVSSRHEAVTERPRHDGLTD